MRALLERHRAAGFARPLPAHAVTSLVQIEQQLNRHGGPLILDSGCGTGESSMALARQNPHALVVAIDKSAARLSIATARAERPSNLIYLRLDLCDCWMQIRACGWQVAGHYLLYPNPWPKQRHLMRRWHAHPVMATMLSLGGSLEMRTNWRIYAEEFSDSVNFLSGREATLETWSPIAPITAFERKYLNAGQPLYRVTVAAD